jgi:diguanylate cyclase
MGLRLFAATGSYMHLERLTETQVLSRAALESLRTHEIPETPDNYAIWYEYHSGHVPNLNRTIDVIVTNNLGFDEKTLIDLYATFFSSAREADAVRDTSLRVQETLRDLIGLADRAQSDSREFGTTLNTASSEFVANIESLNELIRHLVLETQEMAKRNEHIGDRLRDSAQTIETLERNLEGALRDATIDGLTGVANRKSFDTALRKMAGDAMNSGESLSLLLIDIDRFKNVNDDWGHQIGDAVLRHVAQKIFQSVRGQDHVARYGGEEFAVILPHTDTGDAVTAAQNISANLAREPIKLEVTPPMVPVTISIGVSSYELGDPLAEWIGRTDSALYRAKNEGRNRVVSA